MKGSVKSRLGFFGIGCALTVLIGLLATGCDGIGLTRPTVTGVEVIPGQTSVARGGTQDFSHLVIGTYNPPQEVIWRVEGNQDAGTVIQQNGRLAVSPGEGAEFLTVRATSMFNTNISGTARVTVTGAVPVPVSIAAIQGVAVPATGATPVATIPGTAQFTGTVAWAPAVTGGVFAAATAYTATITLTAGEGFTLQGVPANFFTVAGATTVVNAANSGVVTATFPATGAAGVPTYNIDFVIEGNGTASAHPASAAQGATVSISAEPGTGHGLTEWQVVSGGAILSSPTANPATFTMPGGAVTIRAVFTALDPDTPNLIVSRPVFDSVLVGYERPAARNVTITNTGTGTANVTNIALGGDNPGSFELGNHTAVTSIAAGGSATITVRPQAGLGAGTHGATIIVSYGDGRTASNTVSFEVIATHAVTMSGIWAGGTTTVANQAAGAIVPINAGTRPGYTFTGWTSSPAVTFADASSASTTFTMPGSAVTVTASWSADLVPVNIAEIQGVTAPAIGATPVTVITETLQFTGTVAWAAVTRGFVAGTAYTATITLTAREGFTLDGVAANFFTVAGATTVVNAANSGVVTAVFPDTGAATHTVTMVDVRPDGTTTVANQVAGAIVAINAGTRPGYTFAGWTSSPAVTFVDASSPGTALFTMPNAAITVTANWIPAGQGGEGTPDNPIRAVGTSLAEQLGWLHANAGTGRHYLVEILPAETLAPHDLTFDNRIVNVLLRGTAPGTVTVAGPGSLFTVGPGTSLTLGDNVTLHGLTTNTAPLVLVQSDGTFTMNAPTARIIGNTNNAGSSGGGVRVDEGGMFTMNNGVISGNTATSPSGWAGGGGVNVAGVFFMNNGSISDNHVSGNINNNWPAGGGVHVEGVGTFFMSNGDISGNTSITDGGGVNIGSNGMFTMDGGNILGNTANNGGGVHIGLGTFNMIGGIISGNTATGGGHGGGVNIWRGSFNMHGGQIRENTAGESGGGVQLGDAGVFTMHNGTIYGNTAHANGGGVQLATPETTFTMYNGTISNNNAGNNGGGVNSINGGIFTMFAGTISNNTANAYGGGVSAGNGTFYMHGGTILGNRAESLGGGVRVAGPDGFFNMTDGVVYGIDATPPASGNTAGTEASSALYVRSDSTAWWGTAPANWLVSTRYTLHFTDGVLEYTGSRTFAITFAPGIQVDMEEIEGPTISILGTTHPSSTTITVSAPEQFDSIRWLAAHGEITELWVVSGNYAQTLTLDTDFFGDRIGTHFVTVIVDRGGVQNSKRIAVTVRL
ncbi:MAG: InlB B-repeat-containing protein [Treponema sp.]|nr:InlB B-repeat-containing protein [Treponema sp.]